MKFSISYAVRFRLLVPALVLSSFKPGTVLKGGQVKSASSPVTRHSLVVIQFAILIGLIISTITIYQQTRFALSQGLGNVSDLIRGAQSFARRQPTAFLGLAVLAGFGAVRFLKSSADSSDASSEPVRSGGGGFASNQASRSYSDNRGYRDEFTK